jgi:anthranilate synthase component 1/para-aminobenzoate synthetase
MIVGLTRNDLSRNAEPGTVTVTRLCNLETYATVYQLVSTIEARIARERSRAAVAAAYSPGSMTGAPRSAAWTFWTDWSPRPAGPIRA